MSEEVIIPTTASTDEVVATTPVTEEVVTETTPVAEVSPVAEEISTAPVAEVAA